MCRIYFFNGVQHHLPFQEKRKGKCFAVFPSKKKLHEMEKKEAYHIAKEIHSSRHNNDDGAFHRLGCNL